MSVGTDRPRISYLIYREGLNSVFFSQMAVPAMLVAERGWKSRIIAFASVGEFFRSWHRSAWRSLARRVTVPLIRLPSPPARYRNAWNDSLVLDLFLRLSRSKSPSLIDAGGTFAASVAMGSELAMTRAKMIFHMYGLTHEEAVMGVAGEWSDTVSEEYEMLKRLMIACCRGSHAIVCVSDAMKDYAVDYLSADASRVHVIPCCVDTRRFVLTDTDRNEIRTRLGLSSRFVVAYCGSHSVWEAPAMVVRALRTLKAVEPASFGLILTTNPSRFQKDLDAAGLTCQDARAMYVPYDEIPTYLQAADMGLLLRDPSVVNSTASPVKFGEYMASGLPVLISTNVGDFSDAVREKSLGLVIEGEVEASEDAIRNFLHHLKNSSDAIRKRCKDFAAERLSWQSNLPTLEAIYSNLIAHV